MYSDDLANTAVRPVVEEKVMFDETQALIPILEELGVKKSHIRVALARRTLTKESLTVVMKDFGFLDPEGLAKAYSKLYQLDYVSSTDIDHDAITELKKVGIQLDEMHGYVPIQIDQEKNRLTIAISEPQQLSNANLRFRKYQQKIVYASERLTKQLYREHFSRSYEKLLNSIIYAEKHTEERESQQLTYNLLQHGCNVGASDIQLHATREVGVIRYKVDGVWSTIATTSLRLHEQSINRIALLSQINAPNSIISVMKDGAISLTSEQQEADESQIKKILESYQFRVSIGIARFGKSLTIRILENDGEVANFKSLHFDDDTAIKLKRYCNSGSGMLLITGPTGSGKTSTMYALLKEIDPESNSIQTIENPVEYQHGMWLQYEIKRNSDNEDEEWLNILKGQLRNAPNVIMCGEIREASTAKTAYLAATTGHLVFSTLHTDSAPMALRKLILFGINEQDLASQLHGILCVRLIRLLCTQCCVSGGKDDLNAELWDKLLRMKLDTTQIKQAKEGGCAHCNYHGYLGRTQIYELLDMNHRTRELLETGYTISKIREAGIGINKSLTANGLKLVAEGKTSFSELLRVLPREQ